MRQKRKNKIIIFSLLGLLCIMVVGYAAFNTNLKIKGTSGISSNWDIRITNVTQANITGDAEEAKAPIWDKLTASVEANLYQKGDSIEYDVTVENRGTLDAKLENINQNIKSKNGAVLVSISGYTKGEKLLKGSSQIIKVKIEYNPEFAGTVEIGKTDISFDLDYSQAEGGTITPTNDYLLTYDYSTNGGKNSNTSSEYITEGGQVNLNPIAEKEDYEFVGWNTDKDAKEGLTSLSMPSENTTLYAIYKKALNVIYNESGIGNSSCSIYNNEEECEITLPVLPNTDKVFEGWYSDIQLTNKIEGVDNKYNINTNLILYPKYVDDNLELSASTSKTTNQITVVASASAASGISKYEFSNDGGITWIDNEENKIYTFENLTNTKTYSIMVRVTSGVGNTKITSTLVTLDTISIPTYSEAGTTTKTVTITFPEGCGDKYTCTYIKDSGTEVTVTSKTVNVSFSASGTLVGKVSDGTNTVSSSYNVKLDKYTIYLNKNSYESGVGYVTGIMYSTHLYYAVNNTSNGTYNIYNYSGSQYDGSGYVTGISYSFHLYYAVNNTSNGTYNIYNYSGSQYNGSGYVTGLVADAYDEYYAVNNVAAGTYSIYRNKTQLYSGTGYAIGIAVDGNSVYYTVNNVVSGTYAVYRSKTQLYSGTGYATGIGASSSSVYYAVNNIASGTYAIYGNRNQQHSGTGYATGIAISGNSVYYAVNN